MAAKNTLNLSIIKELSIINEKISKILNKKITTDDYKFISDDDETIFNYFLKKEEDVHNPIVCIVCYDTYIYGAFYTTERTICFENGSFLFRINGPNDLGFEICEIKNAFSPIGYESKYAIIKRLFPDLRYVVMTEERIKNDKIYGYNNGIEYESIPRDAIVEYDKIYDRLRFGLTTPTRYFLLNTRICMIPPYSFVTEKISPEELMKYRELERKLWDENPGGNFKDYVKIGKISDSVHFHKEDIKPEDIYEQPIDSFMYSNSSFNILNLINEYFHYDCFKIDPSILIKEYVITPKQNFYEFP